MNKTPFIHDDFLLNTKPARELYHGYAEKMPIIDYHCHLPRGVGLVSTVVAVVV